MLSLSARQEIVRVKAREAHGIQSAGDRHLVIGFERTYGPPTQQTDPLETQQGPDFDSNPFLIPDNSGESDLLNLASTLPYRNWEKMTSLLLKRCSWSRLGDLAKALCKLPVDVAIIFENHERAMNVSLDEKERLTYYKEFMRSALGATVLRFDEVLLANLQTTQLQTIMYVRYLAMSLYPG